MHRRGDRNGIAPRLHKLEDRHLCGRILHRDTIRLERQVALVPDQFLGRQIANMRDKDLLGQRERPAQFLSGGSLQRPHVAIAYTNEVKFLRGHACSLEVMAQYFTMSSL